MPLTIDRRSSLTAREFAREYLDPLRPVIVTTALAAWPALHKWTPEYFRDRWGHLVVAVDGRTMTLAELVGEVLASTAERPAPYLRNQLLTAWPDEIRRDVEPLPECTHPNWLESRLFPSREPPIYLEAYIGGRGAGFPMLHYDGLHTHAYVMEVYGRKEFWVYPPDQTPLLYPRPGTESNKSLVNDVERPDLDRFPLFAKADATRFVLEPGETLFVPAGFWHTTRMLTPTISVSINSANRANWRAFTSDYAAEFARNGRPVRSWATGAYLGLLGYALGGLEPFGGFL
jgi:histone arginine demethylase JMJD6